ncbi:PREDICTED: G-type lectin S-receptor-like serine/threonine-protein kinase At1g34300 [Tarenaya hassleriana]|uniref:G-type lectin S-receptor-like serine/threonine-protein kinase At1g34300 n=1 Tax=Tarenaya hassleriana TaxID=28532 RepID=UPI00053C67B4|nr:PREDICTED: G-type lectin S-receptor-like serine/threonine-protein kinase At1g34300 [Tarenaya hassleriana]XP_010543230.1 PREDICTED: G-type lectin S-receptor-like serine/threonine-protein kinase At1g34300 [Tarenaya hassleriana]XP_010543239.1 PREDICTED: G-type lectin S-receptor-like serine/threonine-protein kinase At1g34300 [Tarenaya hassleriana]
MALLLVLHILLIHLDFSSSLTIPLGSTLQASNLNHSWSSPNSDFSVSFVPAVSPGSFLASVTFSGGITIWSAGAVDSGGSLRLLRSGSLRLIDGSGATVWDSGTESLGVASASLDDSGNLALLNGRNMTVWSSFDHPTDTIVQSQNFTVGKVLRSGSYSFQLLQTGNLTLKWNNSVIYWNQGLNSSFDSNLSSPSFVLQSNGVASVFDSTLSTAAIAVYSSDYGEGDNVFRFVKLDDDGNLRIYASTRGGQTKTPRWAAVMDQCQVFGYCGNYGICTYNDLGTICECPSENFVPLEVNDMRKGCRRKVELEDCRGNEAMLDLMNTRFLTYPPEVSSQRFTLGVSACKFNCLAGSFCVASVPMSDGSGYCFLKPPGFVSGYKNPSLPSTSSIKVCKPGMPNPSLATAKKSDKRQKLHVWIIVVVVIATLLGLLVLEGSLWWCCCRDCNQFGTLSEQNSFLEYASGAPAQFSYRELQRCTKQFKEKLGAGGFGTVYRGMLTNRTVVAVKRLEGIEQGEKQFRMEVATISSTHHLNLVRLIGFCSEGRHRLLVYEFMKNGSLDNFLFSADSGKLLNWESRFNMALGTAKGIVYLHEECRDCVVHCDIKPENILLDENYAPKVSDFGLAKLLNHKENRNRNLSSVRGTRGYLAPEWLANLPITSRSDVYSYGMVLLEIVSGRRNFDISEETNLKKFSIWAYEEFVKGNTQAILDKRLETDGTVVMEQVTRMVRISFWCIQEQPSQRPSMGKVVRMLEGIAEISIPPTPKALAEVSVSGQNKNSSCYISSSMVSTSARCLPSSSSSLTAEMSSSASRRNAGGTSSLNET